MNKNNEMNTNTYMTGDALITILPYHNKRTKKVHFTNFGTIKTNKDGKAVLHGSLCNSYDIADTYNLDISLVNETILTVADESILKMNKISNYDLEMYDLSKNKPLKISKTKTYPDFKINFTHTVIWLGLSTLSKVKKEFKNKGVNL